MTQRITLAYRDLREINGVPDTDKVVTLDISHNRLRDDALAALESFPALETLVADCNRFSTFEHLPVMPRLRWLTCNCNRVTDFPRLVATIRDRCPSLVWFSGISNVCSWEDAARHKNLYLQYRLFVIGSIPTLRFVECAKILQAEREQAARLMADISSQKIALGTLVAKSRKSGREHTSSKKKKADEEGLRRNSSRSGKGGTSQRRKGGQTKEALPQREPDWSAEFGGDEAQVAAGVKEEPVSLKWSSSSDSEWDSSDALLPPYPRHPSKGPSEPPQLTAVWESD